MGHVAVSLPLVFFKPPGTGACFAVSSIGATLFATAVAALFGVLYLNNRGSALDPIFHLPDKTSQMRFCVILPWVGMTFSLVAPGIPKGSPRIATYNAALLALIFGAIHLLKFLRLTWSTYLDVVTAERVAQLIAAPSQSFVAGRPNGLTESSQPPDQFTSIEANN